MSNSKEKINDNCQHAGSNRNDNNDETSKETGSSKSPRGGGGTARQEIVGMLAKRLASTLTEKAQQPLQDFQEKQLPTTADGIRQLAFYNSTLTAIQWQRDNYLVGRSYAEARHEHQEQQQQQEQGQIRIFPLSNSRLKPPSMIYDPTAMGNGQIVNLGAWFVPSATVKEALLPIVVGLPNGALRDPITDTVSNAIPLAQPPLDRAVKNALLEFMKNPHWRQVIKSRTKGFIGSREHDGSTQQDSSQRGNDSGYPPH